MSTAFRDLPYERPSLDAITAAARAGLAAWDAATTAEQQIALITRWDQEQIALYTLRALAGIHFAQDTKDASSRDEKTFFDTIRPDIDGLNLEFLRRVTSSAHREALTAHFGAQALALWDLQLTTFDPRVSDHKRKIAALNNAYDELRASIRVPFRGESHTLSTIRAFFGDADRATRQEALQAQATALSEHAEAFDRLYDELVAVRHDMATQLGFPDATTLAYASLGRTDYGPDDVAAFRKQVREVVLSLVRKIHARRARTLGLERYDFEDESVRDSLGSPRPAGDHDWMMQQASGMFDAMGEDFGAFFAMMRDQDLMDLKSRDAKVGGGFCEALSAHRVPFIFANFNGTQGDVQVFTHECGHAFQYYSSRDLALRDYFWPTLEACEIHSMGLEYLSFPHMERFFGPEADRYRVAHVEDSILFLAYGCTVDEFQHRVYAEPNLTPDERAAVWTELEATYLPNRTYAGMPYFAEGRYWQRQGHIYHEPFYYIDYCLAQVCALQLWRRATEDRDATMALYRRLCSLGGKLPFTKLLAEVGLDNPFRPGCLEGVVEHVEGWLGLE